MENHRRRRLELAQRPVLLSYFPDLSVKPIFSKREIPTSVLSWLFALFMLSCIHLQNRSILSLLTRALSDRIPCFMPFHRSRPFPCIQVLKIWRRHAILYVRDALSLIVSHDLRVGGDVGDAVRGDVKGGVGSSLGDGVATRLFN